MSEPQKTWLEYSKEQLQKAFKKEPIVENGDSLRALVEAMYGMAKADRSEINDRDRCNNFALMIGMATPALLDYAKVLDSRAAEEEK